MDLSSPTNWNLIYEQTLSGSSLNNFLIPESFSSGIIGVYISTSTSKPTWHTGGYINQLVQTNLIDGSSDWNSFSQRLSLGGNIVIFPVPFATYKLQFSFPVWFKNAFVSVWAYTGTTSDLPTSEIATVVSEVAGIISDVATIAEKLNDLIAIVNAIRVIVGG
ncbi:MAG: hypothetical protein V7L23_09935 [Nostoc sp.]|uniref:hypothetical protein n=1 Tax=Nostoc sp. TaxID=1180 RepID=UPI002FF3138B